MNAEQKSNIIRKSENAFIIAFQRELIIAGGDTTAVNYDRALEVAYKIAQTANQHPEIKKVMQLCITAIKRDYEYLNANPNGDPYHTTDREEPFKDD